MRQIVLLMALALLAAAGMLVGAPSLAAQTPPQVQIGKLTFSTVAQWKDNPCGGQPRWATDSCNGLIISNNGDGELRLDQGSQQGAFTSRVVKADFPFNAIGAVWRASVPVSTTIKLEVRGGPTASEADLGAWQPLAAGDARSQSDDGALALESTRPFPLATAFFQLRATFDATAYKDREFLPSPALSEITLSYLDSGKGPTRATGLPRVPAPYGPATLTPPPQLVQRETWVAPASAAPIVRQRPTGIVLHQIGSDDLIDAPPFLRALAAYDTQVLGWDDLPFHFVVDRDGTIYAGRSGGPTAASTRFSGGDAAIHVALIGYLAPPAPQQEALTGLLAWLGQAYDIAPAGQHPVSAGSAAPADRPNIATHAEISRDAADNTDALRALVGPLRQSVDQATVRARWYFAEGNVLNFAERLAVLNPSAGPASVRFSLLRAPGPDVVRDATVQAGGRADVVVNELFNDTTDMPAIVESNAPVIAERFMDFQTDISAGPGVRQPSRVWYFAEGSTEGDRKTYLVLFNPQNDQVSATITYMKGNGTTAEQSVEIPAYQRTVVTVGDALPGAAFGARVIASQPIVAERTMIFGPGSGANTGGFHTAPGVATLSRRWYFAEGTTEAPFQTSILVLNPNAQATNVAVTFLTDSGTSLTRRYAVPPATRLAITVNEVVPELGVATTVTADRPVAAERAMYWGNGAVGTAGAGATDPAFTWRFADGRTSDNFQEYLLLSNPTTSQARVAVEFVLADGKTATQNVLMAKGSRYTMAVHQLYPGQTAIAATVRSTQPIVAERSLYPGAPGAAGSRGGATALGVPEDLP